MIDLFLDACLFTLKVYFVLTLYRIDQYLLAKVTKKTKDMK